MRNISRKVIIVALIFGLIAASLVYMYTKKMEAQYETKARLQPVVVALRTIPAHVSVTAEMVEIKKIPAEYILPSAFRDTKDVVGGISKAEIVPGEQIPKSRVFHGEKDAALAFLVPDNMRAVAVAVDEVIAVGNLIRVGDRVDVLTTWSAEVGAGGREETRTITLLQDVEILAVGQTTDPGVEIDTKEGGFRTITLALEPAKVQHLTLAEKVGSLKLALRSPLDRRILNLGTITDGSLAPVR